MSRFKHNFARGVAAVWRMQTLRLASWTFRAASGPQLVSRPLFGARVFLDVSRSHAQQLLYLQGERFVRERHLIRPFLAPGMTVVDVGANIGYYLLMFEQVIGPKGRVVCFEPEPMNLIELKLNIARNSFGNVSVIEKAVGARPGRVRFGQTINGGVLAPGDSGGMEVEMVALDGALEQRADFLKIDVEGYEGHVLFGAANFIRQHRPRLFVEIHPAMLDPAYSLAEIDDFLKRSYRTVSYHAQLNEGRWARALGAYAGDSGCVVERDLAAVLTSAKVGRYKDIFWVTCTND